MPSYFMRLKIKKKIHRTPSKLRNSYNIQQSQYNNTTAVFSVYTQQRQHYNTTAVPSGVVVVLSLLWCCCDDLCPLVTLVAPVGSSSSSQLWPHRDQELSLRQLSVPATSHRSALSPAARDLVTSPPNNNVDFKVVIKIVIYIHWSEEYP